MVRRFEWSGGRRTHHHYTNTTIPSTGQGFHEQRAKKKQPQHGWTRLLARFCCDRFTGYHHHPNEGATDDVPNVDHHQAKGTPRPADKSASKANERASRARLRIIDRMVYVRLSDYYFSPALLWHSRQPMMDKGTVNPATGLTFTECPRKRRER